MSPLSKAHLSGQLAAWPQQTLLTDELKAYFEYYGFPLEASAHLKSGYIDAVGHKIACHVFTPQGTSVQTILIMHGYLDHSGVHADLVDDLLSKQCTVVVYDMPGHGLSTGEHADINDFKVYVKILQAVLASLEQESLMPDAVVAHSTGGAAVILSVLSAAVPALSNINIILIAPLVRIASWYRIQLTYHLVRRWLAEVKLGRIDNSADEGFIDFLARDPLRHNVMPIQWLEAAFAYEKGVGQFSPSEQMISIIQGTDDTTVAWRYNLRFLRRKFPFARIYCVEGAKHHVLYEEKRRRQRAREILYERLGLKAKAASF